MHMLSIQCAKMHCRRHLSFSLTFIRKRLNMYRICESLSLGLQIEKKKFSFKEA